MPIIDSNVVFTGLREKYPGIEVKGYAFRRFYSTELMVFFDCDAVKEDCLDNALKRVDYNRFVAYAVVEESSGRRYVMDVSYANISGETLERFLRRYPGQLKPSGEMALQLSDRRYLEYIGASYED